MMEWDGIFVATRNDVYEPSDDTFLLARVVADSVRPGDRFLEVGCGTGLIAMAAARNGAQVTATDANPHAVALTRHNAEENGLEVDAREGDLFGGLVGPFEVVAFNPPYLPTLEHEHVDGVLDIAFDGGPDGNAVVLRFADALATLDPLPHTILIVHSSLSDPHVLQERLAGLGYHHDVAAREKHFFEELWVRRFTLGRRD